MTIAISIVSVLIALHVLKYFEVISIEDVNLEIIHCTLLLLGFGTLIYINPSNKFDSVILLCMLLVSYCRRIELLKEFLKLKDQGTGEAIKITGAQDGKTTTARIIERS